MFLFQLGVLCGISVNVKSMQYLNWFTICNITFSHLAKALIQSDLFPRGKSGEVPCPTTQRNLARPGIKSATFWLLARFPDRSATWLTPTEELFFSKTGENNDGLLHTHWFIQTHTHDTHISWSQLCESSRVSSLVIRKMTSVGLTCLQRQAASRVPLTETPGFQPAS